MPLNFLKRGEVKTTGQPRTERSRQEDRFEQNLRLALQDQAVEIRGPTILKDVLAFEVKPTQAQGALAQKAQVKVDFALINPKTRTPFVGIVLSSRSYGRDRRRPPVPSTEDAGAQRAIVTVLHLNPTQLSDVPTLQAALKPYLP